MTWKIVVVSLLGLLGVYLAVRLATAAYYRSKEEHERRSNGKEAKGN